MSEINSRLAESLKIIEEFESVAMAEYEYMLPAPVPRAD